MATINNSRNVTVETSILHSVVFVLSHDYRSNATLYLTNYQQLVLIYYHRLGFGDLTHLNNALWFVYTWNKRVQVMLPNPHDIVLI